jgi:hypothetical protein
MQIEAKLEALGLVLPPPPKLPPGDHHLLRVGPGPWQPRLHRWPRRPHRRRHTGWSLRQSRTRRVVEEAYESARQTALAVLSSLKRTLGDLHRVTAWLMVSGFVNALPGTIQTTNVINGFSDLILELCGRRSDSTPGSLWA